MQFHEKSNDRPDLRVGHTGALQVALCGFVVAALRGDNLSR